MMQMAAVTFVQLWTEKVYQSSSKKKNIPGGFHVNQSAKKQL